MEQIAYKVGEFELTAERWKWIAVHSHNVEDQARLLDVINEIERREAEEIGAGVMRLAVPA